MEEAWLSVIIPTYNGGLYLSQALESIVEQKEPGIECMVVDDGSTDETLQIMAKYQNVLRISCLERERVGNWVANTNFAVARAQGEFVCFLHQDDIWLPDRIRTMKRLIQQNDGVDFFIHSSRFIDTGSRDVGVWHCPLPAYPEVIESDMILERLMVQNFIPIPAPIMRRVAVQRVGGLDEALWYTADWDLWLKLAARSRTVYHPAALCAVRIHTSSQTMVRSQQSRDFRLQLEKVLQRHFSRWSAPDPLKRRIAAIARFSIDANTALAGYYHGSRGEVLRLPISFLRLGPVGAYQYLRDSRIYERASARIRAAFGNRRMRQGERDVP